MSNVRKFFIALLIAIIVTLACLLLGDILDQLTVTIATTIGNFLKSYGSVIGILAGLWFFFADGFHSINTPRV